MPAAPLSEAKRHPIQVVSRRAGLSAHLLRAWEKRYEAVDPGRGPTGRRLYSDEDIERLRLMREAIGGGRRIGDVATLDLAALQRLVTEDREERAAPPGVESPVADTARTVEEALAAIRALDGLELRLLLSRALIALEPAAFMNEVATPIMHRVGVMWEHDQLTPGHEHLATTVFRRLLGEVVETLQPRGRRPAIVVAAPAGQRHELGAMLAAMTAALQGWRVVFLGGDLPARDIAQAAADSGAQAVALSITRDDPGAVAEVETLHGGLGGGVPILAGGQGAALLAGRERQQIHWLPDLGSFGAMLRRVGKRGRAGA
jgi:DNA-binding transcriptional MerR regulator/methylmalonyl-CoA mutase cobalamin-binding subunit